MSKSPSPENKRTRWRKELLQALDGQQIPPAWRDRLLEELDDHLSDLTEETKSMDADSQVLPQTRLGLPHELAAAAAAEYRKLGFLARRPVLTYVVGPLLLTPILFSALALIVIPLMLAAVAAIEGGPAERTGILYGITALAVRIGFHYVPFALLAWAFCWLARRQGRGWRCILPACAMISVYAAMLFAGVNPMPGGKDAITIGVLMPPYHFGNHLQALVPLAIGAMFLGWTTVKDRAVASGAAPGRAAVGS